MNKQELEATVPMLQLVNVHSFLAAARAIGVRKQAVSYLPAFFLSLLAFLSVARH